MLIFGSNRDNLGIVQHDVNFIIACLALVSKQTWKCQKYSVFCIDQRIKGSNENIIPQKSTLFQIVAIYNAKYAF